MPGSRAGPFGGEVDLRGKGEAGEATAFAWRGFEVGKERAGEPAHLPWKRFQCCSPYPAFTSRHLGGGSVIGAHDYHINSVLGSRGRPQHGAQSNKLTYRYLPLRDALQRHNPLVARTTSKLTALHPAFASSRIRFLSRDRNLDQPPKNLTFVPFNLRT